MLTRFLAAGAVVCALALPAAAQQSRPADPDDLPTSQLSLAQVDSIKGAKVRTPAGDDIGDIRDIIVDLPEGRIAFGVVGVGGFLGVGEKNVAVPWERLQPGDGPQSFVLNVDRRTLEQAPALDLERLATAQDRDIRAGIAAFWADVPQQAQAPEPPESDPLGRNPRGGQSPR